MKFALSLFWFLFLGNLFAQSGRTVTLTEAITLAQAHSTSLKKATLDRQSLEYRIKEERSVLYPKINSGLDMDVYPVLPTQLIPGEFFNRPGTYIPVQFGQPWNLTGSLNVQQLIFSESYRQGSKARHDSRALQDLLIEKTTEDIIFNTTSVFYQALQTAELLRSINANLDKLNTLQKIAKLQLDNGYITPTDVKRITVAKTNLETQKQNLTDGIDALHNTLKFLCNVDLDQEFAPTGNFESPTADSLKWQSLEFQPENMTEGKIVQKGMDLLRIRSRALRAERYPDVSAYTSGFYQSQRGNGNFFDGSGRWFGMVAVGFKVRVPIFDGFRRNNKAAQIEYEWLKLDEDRRLLRSAKNLDYVTSKKQVQSALKNLQTQQQNVALAKEIQEKIFLQYKEGMVPLTDLLNTQTALAEAETNYHQQVFSYKMSVLKLLKATGHLHELTQ